MERTTSFSAGRARRGTWYRERASQSLLLRATLVISLPPMLTSAEPAAIAPGGSMKPIPLTLHNRSDLPRLGEPVAVGVPFARGAVRGAPRLVAQTADGRPVATQAETLAEWDDGSVKFALAQFAADALAKSKAEYAVTLGQSPEPAPAVRVQETAETVELDTGPMQVSVGKKRTAGIDRLVIDGKDVLETGSNLRP